MEDSFYGKLASEDLVLKGRESLRWYELRILHEIGMTPRLLSCCWTLSVARCGLEMELTSIRVLTLFSSFIPPEYRNHLLSQLYTSDVGKYDSQSGLTSICASAQSKSFLKHKKTYSCSFITRKSDIHRLIFRR
jgi:hypothetical protein